MSKRVYNFSPGPAILPLSVLEQAREAVLELPGLGMSVLEIGHRSKAFEAILAEAKSLLSELLGIPSGYSILFLQGGSSLQFSMVPMNLLRGSGKTADYILTGTWGTKAFAEAQREGTARAVWDGKSHNYSYLPADNELKYSPDAAYVHITSNETIQGVEFPAEPDTGSIPLVCDASSNFLSRPVRVDRYGLIYACAQKNAGIAGVTVVIVRDDLLEKSPKGLPSMLDYKLQAANDSLYNTPPVFAIYVLLLITRWLKDEIGGLEKMAQMNRRKAKILYDALDKHPEFYRGHARRQPLDNERHLAITQRGVGSRVRQAGQGTRPGRPEGAPLGGRHSRLDLQRHAARGRGRAGRLHARILPATRGQGGRMKRAPFKVREPLA